jgi:hypothetical protein
MRVHVHVRGACSSRVQVQGSLCQLPHHPLKAALLGLPASRPATNLVQVWALWGLVRLGWGTLHRPCTPALGGCLGVWVSVFLSFFVQYVAGFSEAAKLFEC